MKKKKIVQKKKNPTPKKVQKSLDKEIILSFLKDNKAYLKQEFGIKKIALFGSYARDEATKKSDIDIAIVMPEKSFTKRFYLKEFLEKEFHKKVEVCYLDSMRSLIRRNVEQDLIYA
ncbi:MAG: nucleotidyltransferase domain-containing protein [bacterium]